MQYWLHSSCYSFIAIKYDSLFHEDYRHIRRIKSEITETLIKPEKDFKIMVGSETSSGDGL